MKERFEASIKLTVARIIYCFSSQFPLTLPLYLSSWSLVVVESGLGNAYECKAIVSREYLTPMVNLALVLCVLLPYVTILRIFLLFSPSFLRIFFPNHLPSTHEIARILPTHTRAHTPDYFTVASQVMQTFQYRSQLSAATF